MDKDKENKKYNFEYSPSIEYRFFLNDSILEKQPKINERILGVTSGGDLFIDIYGPIIYDILTYWMPLPMSVE